MVGDHVAITMEGQVHVRDETDVTRRNETSSGGPTATEFTTPLRLPAPQKGDLVAGRYEMKVTLVDDRDQTVTVSTVIDDRCTGEEGA